MFNLQPTLETQQVVLLPLMENDFDELYKTASDPKIWEQHPNKNRWQLSEFKNFFEGALLSKGAFKIVNKANNQVIGSTRFYDYDAQNDSIHIGYTFYATNCWGKGINSEVKRTMLNYLFQFVAKVRFQVGHENIRSQIAITRIGAKKIDEQIVSYFGEQPKLNFVYEIAKEEYSS